MLPVLTDRVLEILQSSPGGLTAREVAERLGRTADNIGSRLSKLAAYGIIDKTRGRTTYDAALCAIYHAPSSASSPRFSESSPLPPLNQATAPRQTLQNP
jgi:DNA-binding IclR family transcriptional regulator